MNSDHLVNEHPHAFFTRKGGISQGEFESLNFSSRDGDLEENIQGNLEVVYKHFKLLDGNNFKRTKQIHSNKVIVIKDSNQHSSNLEADALVTAIPNIVLGIMTADCVPILLSDSKNNVIGAVHAGWRGAFTNIIYNAVNSMIECGAKAENITAIIGPSIRQETYEVDHLFYKNFMRETTKNSQYFTTINTQAADKYMFDLQGYCLEKLVEAGVKNNHDLKCNTYTNKELFFSCRRSFHEGTKFGCQMSAIMMRE